jgi:hypothetical protein
VRLRKTSKLDEMALDTASTKTRRIKVSYVCPNGTTRPPRTSATRAGPTPPPGSGAEAARRPPESIGAGCPQPPAPAAPKRPRACSAGPAVTASRPAPCRGSGEASRVTGEAAPGGNRNWAGAAGIPAAVAARADRDGPGLPPPSRWWVAEVWIDPDWYAVQRPAANASAGRRSSSAARAVRSSAACRRANIVPDIDCTATAASAVGTLSDGPMARGGSSKTSGLQRRSAP